MQSWTRWSKRPTEDLSHDRCPPVASVRPPSGALCRGSSFWPAVARSETSDRCGYLCRVGLIGYQSPPDPKTAWIPGTLVTGEPVELACEGQLQGFPSGRPRTPRGTLVPLTAVGACGTSSGGRSWTHQAGLVGGTRWSVVRVDLEGLSACDCDHWPAGGGDQFYGLASSRSCEPEVRAVLVRWPRLDTASVCRTHK